MRDYQRKKSKYILPDAVYHQVLWQIRDYYRLKDEAQAILEESPPPPDGLPHGNPDPDGVMKKVARRLELVRMTDMIEDELQRIPPEYRRGVWASILYRTAFPADADRTTYARYKSSMIYNIAERQGLI